MFKKATEINHTLQGLPFVLKYSRDMNISEVNQKQTQILVCLTLCVCAITVIYKE